MKKIRFIFIMALILTVFSGGFVLAKQADWPDEVEFAAVPTESVATMSERLDPIVKELEKALGIKVRLRHASDYRGVIEAIRSEKIEFAMFGPKSYIEARDNYGNCEPIVKQIEDNGSGGYRSCLIASTETDIFSPEDAQGASFAFNDPNSTSGYLVPMTLFLQKLKTKPDNYFSKVTFSGSHEASIITVANGHVEAASTNLEAIKRAVAGNKIDERKIRVIWVSDLIPNDPIAVRTDLPESFRKALQQALINMDKSALKKAGWGGFTIVDDSHYQPIRDLNNLRKELQNN